MCARYKHTHRHTYITDIATLTFLKYFRKSLPQMRKKLPFESMNHQTSFVLKVSSPYR